LFISVDSKYLCRDSKLWKFDFAVNTVLRVALILLYNLGRIYLNDWCDIVTHTLELQLPWRTLKSRLVDIDLDGTVLYESTFRSQELQCGGFNAKSSDVSLFIIYFEKPLLLIFARDGKVYVKQFIEIKIYLKQSFELLIKIIQVRSFFFIFYKSCN
jgi:hypothetical protein